VGDGCGGGEAGGGGFYQLKLSGMGGYGLFF
jgi:hypothetical protein